VMFDGRIGITHLDTPPACGAVLFCEAEPLAVTTPRIVLHGSAHHVVTSASSLPAGDPETCQDGGYSLPAATSVAEIIDAIGNARRPDRVRGLRQIFDRAAEVDSDLQQNLATYFREVVCTDNYREFSSYLGGHARVTAVLRPPRLPFPVVLASPLYVRYERSWG
jgi:hypothetical protein